MKVTRVAKSKTLKDIRELKKKGSKKYLLVLRDYDAGKWTTCSFIRAPSCCNRKASITLRFKIKIIYCMLM